MAEPIKAQIRIAKLKLEEYIGKAARYRGEYIQNRVLDALDIRGLIIHLKNKIADLNKLNEKWSRLLQDVKLATTSEKEYTEALSTYTSYSNVEDSFIQTIENGQEAISDLEHLILAIESKSNAVLINTSTKLPKLSLPNFSGKYSEWPVFWSSFCSAVHDKANLRNVDKFNYLKSCLSGKALLEVDGYPATNDNYDTIVSLLKKRFGDERALITNLYSEIRKICPAKNDIPSIRRTITDMERIFRLLENAGEDIKNPSMEILAESKMPQWLLLEILKIKNNSIVWNLDNFRKKIDEIVSLRESVYEMSRNYGTAPVNNNQYRRNNYNSGRNQFSSPNNSRFERANNNQVLSAINEQNKINYNQKYVNRANPKFGQNKFNNNGQNKFNQNQEHKNTFKKYSCVFCGSQGHMGRNCEKYKDYDSRLKRLRDIKRCERCLSEGHSIKNCSKKIECRNCGANHYALMCRRPKNMSVNVINDNNEIENEPINVETCEINEDFVTSTFENMPENNKSIYLMSLKAKIINPKNGKILEKLVFFDPGSTKRFMSQECAKSLGYNFNELPREELNVFGFNQSNPSNFTSHKIKFEIPFINGQIRKFVANTVPKITKPMNILKLDKIDDPIPDVIGTDKIQPDILLSIEDFWDMFEFYRKLKSGLRLIQTKIGPILCCRFSNRKFEKPIFFHNNGKEEYVMTFRTEKNKNSNKIEEDKEENFERKYWDLETIGIVEDPNLSITEEDNDALDQYNSTVKRLNDGRYEVHWPWRSGSDDSLPLNYNLAYHRLKSALHRLNQKPELLKKYDDIIKEQIENDIIEEVPIYSDFLTHYLPHQPVIKETSAHTKLRIVYDASAKVKECKSLNDQLLRGPSLLPNLAGVLLRIKFYKYLLIGDIAKAFLQLQLHESQRDVTRFLWVRNTDEPLTSSNKVIYRFKRVLFGVISSPFLLVKTIHHHLENYCGTFGRKNLAKLCRSIKLNLYMDNILIGANNKEECLEKYKQIKEIFAEAQMNVREFLSNDSETNSKIPIVDKHPSGPEIKLLGIKWNTNYDHMEISLPKCENTTPNIDKRAVLAKIHSIFDPLGILAPILLKAKLFFQNLCSENYKWEKVLDEQKFSEWQQILKEWDGIKFTFPRYILNHPTSISELHVFVDASEKAYASTVYIRIQNGNNIDTNLIFSKNRIAPLKKKGTKPISIPKLELLAILIGVRSAKFIIDELEFSFSRVVIWSDSQCNLHRISTPYEDERDRFVRNRLKEIQKYKGFEFRWVPTESNPADISSRGMTASDLKICEKWWKGPSWLSFEEFMDDGSAGWPTDLIVFPPTEEENCSNSDYETPAEYVDHPNGSHATSTTSEDFVLSLSHVEAAEEINSKSKNSYKVNTIIDPEKFSSWSKLVRFTLYTFRLLSCKIAKIEKLNEKIKYMNQISKSGNFTANDVKIAENYLFRQAQNGNMPSEKLKNKLNMFINNGLIRCKSRMNESNFDLANPIYLPSHNRITHLLILHYHFRFHHSGVIHLLAQLRQNFFIPKSQTTVRKAIKMCKICPRYNNPPYALPEMGKIPEMRLKRSMVFENVGLDYTGPFKSKIFTPDGFEKVKVWVLLLTCLNTRAVHLELVQNMSTETFIRAFTRFISRRGTPKNLISDNASQFLLGKKLVDKCWNENLNDPEIHKYFSIEKINWRMISAYSPWKGGSYERLNSFLKNAFKKSLGRNILELDEFHTFLVEVESMINSRPITPINSDLNDLTLLRPIDFLIPFGKTGLPGNSENLVNDPNWHPPTTDSSEKLIEGWKIHLGKLDEFWESWYTNYLGMLRDRSFDRLHKTPHLHNKNRPQLGEIVLIHDDFRPRSAWKFGRILKVKTSSVALWMPNGKEIERPFSAIYSLELPDIPENIDSDNNDDNNEINNNNDENNYRKKLRSYKKAIISNNSLENSNIITSESIMKFDDRNNKHKLNSGGKAAKKQSKTNISATNLCQKIGKFGIYVLLICMIFLPIFAQGIQPMICPNAKTSSYWRINEFDPPCTNFSRNSPIPVDHTFRIFKPNTDLVEIPAAHCSIVEETIEYRTDLINNQHIIKYHKSLPVTNQECMDMWIDKKCQYGNLTGEKCYSCDPSDGRTNNKVEIEFSYWQIGSRNISTVNCFINKNPIFVHPGTQNLSSPIADITHCKFSDGLCRFGDNSIQVWRQNGIQYETDTRLCKFSPIVTWNGTYSGNVWVSDNQEFALSFRENPMEILDCNQWYVISEQGMAVQKQQFQLLKNKLGIYRQKRDDNWEEIPKLGMESTNQAAMQLSALQILETKQIRNIFSHLSGILCSKFSGIREKLSLRALNPTIFTRNMLNDPYLEARWVDNDILEIRKCMPIPFENLSFIPSENCYHKIPVKMDFMDKKLKGFLDPDNLVLAGKSGEGSCEYYRHRTIKIDNNLIQVDQNAGIYKVINESAIRNLTLGSSYVTKMPDLETHTFHNYMFSEYKDPREQVIKMFQIYDNEKGMKMFEKSDESYHEHQSKLSFQELIPLWYPKIGLDDLKQFWIYSCCCLTLMNNAQTLICGIGSSLQSRFSHIPPFSYQSGKEEPELKPTAESPHISIITRSKLRKTIPEPQSKTMNIARSASFLRKLTKK